MSTPNHRTDIEHMTPADLVRLRRQELGRPPPDYEQLARDLRHVLRFARGERHRLEAIDQLLALHTNRVPVWSGCDWGG